MAATKKDSLESLQAIFNDVLVQTGKAVRASRKDANQSQLTQSYGIVQPKLPQTLASFHSALDRLEGDIVRAKSVLLRDLNEIHAVKAPTQAPAQAPEPVQSQSRSPVVIDLESSSPVQESVPMAAPFPDMGQVFANMAQQDAFMDNSSQSAAPAQANTAPFNAKPQGASAGIPFQGANFTNMQFDLAPAAKNGLQGQPGSAQEPTFDMAAFATQNINANANGDMLTLNNFLPVGPQGQTNAANGPPSAQGPSAGNQGRPGDKTAGAGPGSGFLNPDGTPADGMDFDFGLDAGDGTFDDLMQARDEDYGTMEHGDFDATFFGVDTTNDT